MVNPPGDPAQNADLVRLRDIIDQERQDPDKDSDRSWAEGWEDALVWVLDEIHGLLNDGVGNGD